MFDTFRLGVIAAVVFSLARRPSRPRSPPDQLKDRKFHVVIGSLAGVVEYLSEVHRPGQNIVYFQTSDAWFPQKARIEQRSAGYLGSEIFVEHGAADRIHLADNVADSVYVFENDPKLIPPREELLRVVRPAGEVTFWLKEGKLKKDAPPGAGQWTHPYHGPDNNPQSEDRLARPPYRTQFLAEPYYVPFPEVTVAAGGRVFKAFGHVGYKKRDWPWLNKLVAFNAYNGTQLWQRPLEEGFKIHRNTMIATDDALLVADSKSCKRLDAVTGEVKSEIVIPAEQGGPVWKWMALDGGVLYALLGGEEPRDETLRGDRAPPAGRGSR